MSGDRFNIVLSNSSAERRFPMQSRNGSQVGSPQFRVDLTPHLGSGGDSFIGMQFPHPPSSKPGQRALGASESTSGYRANDRQFVVSGRLALLVWLTQCAMLITIASMVFGLVYVSFSLNSGANWYSDFVQPYISEMRMRTMSVLRNADHSSASLEHIMSNAEQLTLSTVPALMDSVNRTTATVARLEHLARNPTIKLSVGA